MSLILLISFHSLHLGLRLDIGNGSFQTLQYSSAVIPDCSIKGGGSVLRFKVHCRWATLVVQHQYLAIQHMLNRLTLCQSTALVAGQAHQHQLLGEQNRSRQEDQEKSGRRRGRMGHNHDDTPCQRVQHMTLSESLSLAPAAISRSTTSE